MDVMILETQKWLNSTYRNDSRFNAVTEDGITGWETIYGLTRALQIELGIQNTADNFGPTSRNLYSQNQLQRADGVHDRKFAILQGALWCKGYNPGHYYSEGIDGYSDVFDASVEEAVKQLKTDAGILNPNGVVTTNFMAALLSMDYFVLLSAYGGDANVRSFQQQMNRKYEAYTGIMPCDGIYSRNTNKAVIYAIQAEEGLPVSVANANFGPTTKNCCPTIPYTGKEKNYYGNTYSSAQINSFTEIFKFALYVNGFGTGVFTGTLDTATVINFQTQYGLPTTGKADLQTWMSTLVSCGDNTRKGTACDTRHEITDTNLTILVENGYQYVGRYLIGGDFKEIKDGELARLFNAGLRVFPIYQDSGTAASYFTAEQGEKDARAAEQAARSHGVPRGTTIYFAVDFDAVDKNIKNNIIPYFRAVHDNLKKYTVGIYGPRNVCIQVSDAGYSEKSFVSDMSTGFSGNLGFPMPDDWSFDQISNIYISHNGNTLEIDNDIASGRDIGFNTLAPYRDPNESYCPAPKSPVTSSGATVRVNKYSESIPVYAELVPSGIHSGGTTAGGDIIGYIKPNDFYTCWIALPDTHVYCYSVLIAHEQKGVIRGYIDPSCGVDFDDQPWAVQQGLFANYNSNGTGLVGDVPTETIDGKTYKIFTVKRQLDYLSDEGVYQGTIGPNTKIAVLDGDPGSSNPNYICFHYYDLNGTWESAYDYWDVNDNLIKTYGFIDLGYQYGAEPANRAIW